MIKTILIGCLAPHNVEKCEKKVGTHHKGLREIGS